MTVEMIYRTPNTDRVVRRCGCVDASANRFGYEMFLGTSHRRTDARQYAVAYVFPMIPISCNNRHRSDIETVFRALLPRAIFDVLSIGTEV